MLFRSFTRSLAMVVAIGLGLVWLASVSIGVGAEAPLSAAGFGHRATSSMQGHPADQGSPRATLPVLPEGLLAESVEDEVDSVDPSGSRFPGAARSGHAAARTADEALSRQREDVGPLLARAADHGRLCRRLL